MLLAETVLAISTICTGARKKSSEQELYYATDGKSCQSTFQIFSGTSMEKILISEFQEIEGVSDTRVRQDEKGFFVEIDLSAFNRPTRNKVFAKERDLYREFPDTDFEFCVVDVSPVDSEDAHSIRTSLQG